MSTPSLEAVLKQLHAIRAFVQIEIEAWTDEDAPWHVTIKDMGEPGSVTARFVSPDKFAPWLDEQARKLWPDTYKPVGGDT